MGGERPCQVAVWEEERLRRVRLVRAVRGVSRLME
jgi:hypothetical protein